MPSMPSESQFSHEYINNARNNALFAKLRKGAQKQTKNLYGYSAKNVVKYF